MKLFFLFVFLCVTQLALATPVGHTTPRNRAAPGKIVALGGPKVKSPKGPGITYAVAPVGALPKQQPGANKLTNNAAVGKTHG